MTTEELEQFVRDDIEKRTDESDTDMLFAVLEELADRREAAGVKLRSNEEAYQEFLKHYAPKADDSINPFERLATAWNEFKQAMWYEFENSKIGKFTIRLADKLMAWVERFIK